LWDIFLKEYAAVTTRHVSFLFSWCNHSAN